MVAAGAAGMEVGRFEHCSHLCGRALQILIAAAEDERAPGRRLHEMEQHPQRRCLPGAVRAEKAGHRSALERERQIVHRDEVTEPLAQMLRANDRLLADGQRGLRFDSMRRRRHLDAHDTAAAARAKGRKARVPRVFVPCRRLPA